MCQFCHQHGEGKRWYLRAENYSEELASDLDRRRYMVDFISRIGNGRIASLEKEFQRGLRAPAWLRQCFYWFYERRCRRDHFGQVVPLDELSQVLSLANSIVRLPCICRKNSTGRNDARYCLGLSMDPEKLLEVKEAFLETFRPGPHTNLFERLDATEALELVQNFEKQGMIHTLWTFKTPFIGGLCNCDRADCLAMVSYRYEFQLFFRGEYVAEVHDDVCIGCRACLSLCQFGALGFSAVHHRIFIDPLRCYGCGLCKNACESHAIRLTPRIQHPLAHRLW
jgi:ferredoxin